MTARGQRPLVEVAVDSVEAAVAAEAAGADRIELCQALELGGLTPSAGLIEEALRTVGLPVFAMIRPRPGPFVLGPGDLAVMRADLARIRDRGAAGAVVGALTAQGTIDRDALVGLVETAAGMDLTFHRAFDSLAAPVTAAMAELRALGVTRVLSSGGAATASGGRGQLASLVRCGTPIVVAAGGIVAETVVDLVRTTEAREIHLSGVMTVGPSAGFGRASVANLPRLRAVLAALDAEFGPRSI